MTVYVFDHYLVNGVRYGGPQISIQVNGDVTVIAVYREFGEPPSTDLSKLIPVALVWAVLSQKK